MYLSEIYLENTGPISKCHVEMPFDDNGNPLPVVVVGPNGSGKSISLSYIVDALMEFAKVAFRDIVPRDGVSKPYYRFITPMAIRSGAPFSLSLLRFQTAQSDYYYCEKSGDLDPNTDYPSEFKSRFASIWNWPPNGNYKQVSTNKKTVEAEMNEGAHVFFPASRREDPEWLNPTSIKHESVTPAPYRLLHGQLSKPIRVETCAEGTISWVLDVFLDSMVDFDMLNPNATRQSPIDLRNRQILLQARQNVERILQAILQDPNAELELNLRNLAPSRLAIRLSNGRIIPSLQSLSEGQLQLFNLFITIIRYGERNNINLSIRLTDISGIVLIDEIDAHLHATLQHDVVPQLIQLFPKVQFIVSSHSPLLLLGMEKVFGSDGFRILELPTGRRINSERYSEFGNAFQYYQETKTFQQQVEQRFKDGTKPLVLTEGKLDASYIGTALDVLNKSHLLDAMDVDFVGIEHEEGARGGGRKGLDNFGKVYETNPSLFPRPILLLYDCDVKKRDNHIDRLWVRSIPTNPENTKVKKGIENLFPESFFEDENRFYRKTQKADGGISTELDKNALRDWICDERKNPGDFAKFSDIVQILEEFLNAHQSL